MSLFSGNKILIFDECKFMANLLFEIISSFEVGQLIVCNTLKDAKYYVNSMRFDCVFSDWNGWPEPELGLLQHIRYSGEANDPSVPIIVFTAQTTIHSIIKARDYGCSEVVTKPVSPSNVFDKIYASIFKNRQFIAVDSYTGPDRRRNSGNFNGIERRTDRSLQQAEIDSLLAGEVHE